MNKLRSSVAAAALGAIMACSSNYQIAGDAGADASGAGDATADGGGTGDDASGDAGADAAAADTGPGVDEAGDGSACGPTNTPANCGVCGHACTTPDAGLMAASSCCGTTCVTQHATGYGQIFYDCVAAGAWGESLAMDACVSYFGTGTCRRSACTGAVEGVSQACITWDFAGPAIGHTREGAIGGACACPRSTDQTWY